MDRQIGGTFGFDSYVMNMERQLDSVSGPPGIRSTSCFDSSASRFISGNVSVNTQDDAGSEDSFDMVENSVSSEISEIDAAEVADAKNSSGELSTWDIVEVNPSGEPIVAYSDGGITPTWVKDPMGPNTNNEGGTLKNDMGVRGQALVLPNASGPTIQLAQAPAPVQIPYNMMPGDRYAPNYPIQQGCYPTPHGSHSGGYDAHVSGHFGGYVGGPGYGPGNWGRYGGYHGYPRYNGMNVTNANGDTMGPIVGHQAVHPGTIPGGPQQPAFNQQNGAGRDINEYRETGFMKSKIRRGRPKGRNMGSHGNW